MSDRIRGVNVREQIREAVKKKGKHYGLLPHPLIVAINVDAISVDRIYEIQGLYGQREGDLSDFPLSGRKPNGAWFGKKGPQYTRVGGAWIFHGLSPWNIVSRKNTVYLNPWASKPLPTLFTTFHHARVEGNQIQWVDGRSIGEILGLPTGWPE